MTWRTALFCLCSGLWLPQCIQTSAQCAQPGQQAQSEQTGEQQTADGMEVEARGSVREQERKP
jgi:hypothetical protein